MQSEVLNAHLAIKDALAGPAAEYFGTAGFRGKGPRFLLTERGAVVKHVVSFSVSVRDTSNGIMGSVLPRYNCYPLISKACAQQLSERGYPDVLPAFVVFMELAVPVGTPGQFRRSQDAEAVVIDVLEKFEKFVMPTIQAVRDEPDVPGAFAQARLQPLFSPGLVEAESVLMSAKLLVGCGRVPEALELLSGQDLGDPQGNLLGQALSAVERLSSKAAD